MSKPSPLEQAIAVVDCFQKVLDRIDKLRLCWNQCDLGPSGFYSEQCREAYALAQTRIDRRASRWQRFVNEKLSDGLRRAAVVWPDPDSKIADADYTLLSCFLEKWPVDDPYQVEGIRGWAWRTMRAMQGPAEAPILSLPMQKKEVCDPECLGLTSEEFDSWVKDGRIVREKKNGKDNRQSFQVVLNGLNLDTQNRVEEYSRKPRPTRRPRTTPVNSK